MSEKSTGAKPSPNSIDTLIGAGMLIEGTVACAGVLRLQGEILGDVTCCDRENGKGFLVVDSSGDVRGHIAATHLAVRGRITGPVLSARSIEVHAGGCIEGDIAFGRLAIHPGGIVNGFLKPDMTATAGETSATPPAMAPLDTLPSPLPSGSSDRGRRLGLAAGMLAVAVVLALMLTGRDSAPKPVADDSSAVAKAEVFLREAKSPAPAAETVKLREEVKPAAAPANGESVAAMPAPLAAATDLAEKSPVKAVTVRGANPNRPAGVFLLISNGATTLFRKKQDDAGEGLRVPITQGEKISVAIAPDDLIRVAKGADVVIFFQGQKVPSEMIESGAWIKFVPR